MDRYLIIAKDVIDKTFHIFADNVRDLIEVILVAETNKYSVISITKAKNSYTASEFFKFIGRSGKDDLLYGGNK